MKDIKLILSAALLISIISSCEKQDSDNSNINVTFSPTGPVALRQNLISSWSFDEISPGQYSLDDMFGKNVFYPELQYDRCWYDYVPGKVSTAIWIRTGQIKCESINSYITDGKPFSFFFWGNGYNQQDDQRYFTLKSDNNIFSLNIKVGKAYPGKINDYKAYFNTSIENLASVKINQLKQWYYYGITFENSELKFYINGELISTDLISDNIKSTDQYYIIFSPYYDFNSIYIDNVKLYDKALKQNEIMSLYKYEE